MRNDQPTDMDHGGRNLAFFYVCLGLAALAWTAAAVIYFG